MELQVNIKQWSYFQKIERRRLYMAFSLFVTLSSYLKQTLFWLPKKKSWPKHSSEKRALDGSKVKSLCWPGIVSTLVLQIWFDTRKTGTRKTKKSIFFCNFVKVGRFFTSDCLCHLLAQSQGKIETLEKRLKYIRS